MQQWEYCTEVAKIDWKQDSRKSYGLDKGRLMQLGNEGWELVSVAPITGSIKQGFSQTVEIQYILKRPRPAAKTNSTAKPSSISISAEDAELIQSFVDRHPTSELAKSGVAARIQSVKDKNASSNGKH